MSRNSKFDMDFRRFYSGSFLVRVGIIAFLGSVVLAIAGPFDTYSQGNVGWRFLFWSVVVFVSLALAGVIKPFAWRYFPNNRILREIVSIAVFVPVFLPFLLLWINVVFPSQVGVRMSLWYLATNVAVISAIVSVCVYVVPLLAQARAEDVASAQENAQSPFLYKRLPDGFSGEILRLSGDGHYVNVTTTEGTHDIRMRLSDAVGEMNGVAGFWTHRSHWVASDAIRDWRKLKSGKTVLVLKNSDEVPVTAKYQPDLEEAGFVLRRGIETENV